MTKETITTCDQCKEKIIHPVPSPYLVVELCVGSYTYHFCNMDCLFMYYQYQINNLFSLGEVKND